MLFCESSRRITVKWAGESQREVDRIIDLFRLFFKVAFHLLINFENNINNDNCILWVNTLCSILSIQDSRTAYEILSILQFYITGISNLTLIRKPNRIQVK